MANTKKIISCCSVFLLVAAHDLQASGLQDMWNSNVTAPTSVDTKNRHAFVGGSAAFRTPVKSISLFNYSPPRVSAGCSGADIYMGSFSYINKDQIVSTLKAIMNNAQGLLFQAAIEFVSPMISGLMTKFNDIATKLNSMQMNSCEIATAGKGAISKAFSSHGDAVAADLSNAQGSITDWLTLKTDPTTNTAANAASAEDMLSGGNLTWRGLENAGSGKKLSLPLFNLPAAAAAQEKYTKEVLLSMVGSFVSTTAQSGDALKPASYPIDHQLGFIDLKNGGEGKSKYVCNDVKCLDWTAEPLNFIDAYTYVDVMMYGDPAWLTAGNTKTAKDNLANSTLLTASVHGKPVYAHTKSIAAIIAGATTANKSLDADQSRFLDVMDAPVVMYLRDIHGDEYSNVKELTNKIRERMALSVIRGVAVATLASLRGLETAQNTDAGGSVIAGANAKVEIPDNVKKRIEQLNAEYLVIDQEYVATSESMTKAKEFVDAIIARRSKTSF